MDEKPECNGTPDCGVHEKPVVPEIPVVKRPSGDDDNYWAWRAEQENG